jgi:PD-(D/E)XK endonuclease
MAAMLALNEAGFAVSIPFGENVRYDLIIDDGCRLARVQCKTGRLRQGAVLFNVCSCYGHHLRPTETRRDYRGQVDYFVVYCSETSGVYLVPIEDLTMSNQASLRIEPPRNGQRLRIRNACDYEIGLVSATATAEPGATSGG